MLKNETEWQNATNSSITNIGVRNRNIYTLIADNRIRPYELCGRIVNAVHTYFILR